MRLEFNEMLLVANSGSYEEAIKVINHAYMEGNLSQTAYEDGQMLATMIFIQGK